MRHPIIALFLLLLSTLPISAQEMHRKLGASFQVGASLKTARSFGRFGSDGTTIKPGAILGCNLRYRLSPKSSLQFSGNLVLDRLTIRNHAGSVSTGGTGWPDTTYSNRQYGDVELKQLYWQGVLSYRYTLNYRWGVSLGIRTGELLKEEGNYTVTYIERYRRVESEITLISSSDVVRENHFYWIRNSRYDSGLQSNIYCQLNRRLQLIASFDTAIPFVKYVGGYTFRRYKVIIAHRLF